MQTTEDKEIRLDLGEVLRQKMPRHYRYIPRFVVGWLEWLICAKQLNEIARKYGKTKGVEFARGVLEYLDVRVRVDGECNLPAAGSRCVMVCNHPMGGLDGIAIIANVGAAYGGNVRFLVNDLLMAVTPLAEVFLPINKFGRQSRHSAEMIELAYRGDGEILSFPAGLCSRMQPDGRVEDLKWQKSFVMKAVEYERDVVPMYFDGCNSRLFYRAAKWRKRLGIRFNFEQMLLPREMMKCRGREFVLYVGKPIPWQTLKPGDALGEAERIKRVCYSLGKKA